MKRRLAAQFGCGVRLVRGVQTRHELTCRGARSTGAVAVNETADELDDFPTLKTPLKPRDAAQLRRHSTSVSALAHRSAATHDRTH